MLAARTQLPGGECRGTPFYILIVEIEPPVCHVTERATSVRTAGARGERSRRIVVGKWKRSGRERIGLAREREGSRGSYDRSREIERSDSRDGGGGASRGASK